MTILPSGHAPRDVYRLMTGMIVPRPIAFVSSLSREGVRNPAPFSFFTAVRADPPVVCFSPMIRGADGSRKDTLLNIEATGEFVVNIVSEEIARQMNACSAEVLLFHVDDALFDRYTLDPDRLHAFGRMGGSTYVRTADRFEMPRPPRQES